MNNLLDGFRWSEEHDDGTETVILVYTRDEVEETMVEGQMIDAIIGMNNIVFEYPGLKFTCRYCSICCSIP